MAVSIDNLKTKQVAVKSKKILELVKEIKSLTGAYGVGAYNLEKIVLQMDIKKVFSLGTTVTMTEQDSDTYPYRFYTVIEGVEHFAIVDIKEILDTPEALPLWEDYCTANNLCTQCGAENVENSEYRNCPNNCWGEYKA